MHSHFLVCTVFIRKYRSVQQFSEILIPCWINSCHHSHQRATSTIKKTRSIISWSLYLPVSSSRISTSVVFRSRRTSAGIPPQFFKAILLSSLALPYTRFLSAPHELRCTSVIRWSNKSTSNWMPPCRRIWKQNAMEGISKTSGTHENVRPCCCKTGKHHKHCSGRQDGPYMPHYSFKYSAVRHNQADTDHQRI